MDNKANQTIKELLAPVAFDHNILSDPEVAHLIVHHNQVIGAHLIEGLTMDIEELTDGIRGKLRIKEGSVIQKPVQICFGMLPQSGIQRILLDTVLEKSSSVSIIAHCIFPNAVDLQHIMEASIRIGENASYSYFEKHIHSSGKGLKVYPNAVVEVEKNGRFKTEFELLKGRVGELEIDYETKCAKNAVMDMNARVYGREDDHILIKETGHLQGDHSRGVLTSRIALKDKAVAEIRNKLVASGSYARGHVDCKEIVQGQAVASAIPIVEVKNPKAHVTHEAAIGSVDNKQLETLMSRGLSEDEATDLIISGLLSK